MLLYAINKRQNTDEITKALTGLCVLIMRLRRPSLR